MKKIIISAVVVFMLLPLTAQNSTVVTTKKDKILSETETHIKFTDKDLPKFDMVGIFLPRTKVRKVETKNGTSYFYLVESQASTADVSGNLMGKLSTKTGGKENVDWQWIEYSDVVAINTAITKFKTDVEQDIASGASYVEQTYVTSEGFHVGYRVSEGKASWFFKMSPKDPEVFAKAVENIVDAFANAQKELDVLKK